VRDARYDVIHWMRATVALAGSKKYDAGLRLVVAHPSGR
jgi:hypothetical protein